MSINFELIENLTLDFIINEFEKVIRNKSGVMDIEKGNVKLQIFITKSKPERKIESIEVSIIKYGDYRDDDLPHYQVFDYNEDMRKQTLSEFKAESESEEF